MIGIDVVSVPRFRQLIAEQPGLSARLFTTAERRYCGARPDPARHLAGTLAAKEAVIKCLQLGPLVAWARRVEVVRGTSGAPHVRMPGGPSIPISITHDGDVAIAVALLSGAPTGGVAMQEREEEIPERESEPQSEDDAIETDAAGRDEVEEASEESFPASDPPSY